MVHTTARPPPTFSVESLLRACNCSAPARPDESEYEWDCRKKVNLGIVGTYGECIGIYLFAWIVCVYTDVLEEAIAESEMCSQYKYKSIWARSFLTELGIARGLAVAIPKNTDRVRDRIGG